MAKAKLRFTERDVSRAIRATAKAGVQVGRVVVDTAGNIVVIAAARSGDDTLLEQRKAGRAAGARRAGH